MKACNLFVFSALAILTTLDSSTTTLAERLVSSLPGFVARQANIFRSCAVVLFGIEMEIEDISGISLGDEELYKVDSGSCNNLLLVKEAKSMEEISTFEERLSKIKAKKAFLVIIGQDFEVETLEMSREQRMVIVKNVNETGTNSLSPICR